MTRWVCEHCRDVTLAPLRAEHPFQPGVEIYGCPTCREIDPCEACDEPSCAEAATCGTPTVDGYRRTCGAHAPPLEGPQ